MAVRGSSKERSVRHEDFIARLYGGTRSKSSGGADTDQGDVRTRGQLMECKVTGKPEKPAKLPGFIKHLEKVTEEAWSEDRIPTLALRYFNPDSLLANRDGFVDVIVRRAQDDAILVEDSTWP
jgi:hypothetical protein